MLCPPPAGDQGPWGAPSWNGLLFLFPGLYSGVESFPVVWEGGQ